MRDELDKLLCEKYPKIFADRHGDPKETLMCFGFGCNDGWFPLIDQLCHSIQNYIDYNSRPDRPIPQVVAEQVKEKFGSLRFYYQGGNELIHGMVWFAESMSYRICEVCGNPGTVREGGWIKTLCDQHHNESQKRRLKMEECND